MGRRPMYFKPTACECNDEGCELCTCADCGNWLECCEGDVCEACLDAYDEEHGGSDG